MVQPLLSTKLFLPQVRAGRVQRERLLSRLDALLNPAASIGLISAPAGFGKTSLLAEWIHRTGKDSAWLSVDAGDNHAGSFIKYLCAALERARPGLSSQTSAAHSGQPQPTPGDLLHTLINELAAKTSPDNLLIIALDDVHIITSQETRDCLGFLAEHLPPGARLAIASRADPSLPLARMRAGGRIVELRAADLRFTAQEAADFLQHSFAGLVHVSGETAAALAERTEGWAAGLQMAAVAMQAAPGTDPAQFVRSFTGSHRFVLDYLAEEVLSRLPEETVQFLLHTSVLERFCAGLCSAVLPADSQPSSAQDMLETLERANLFLIPLDAERRWYRYHHLFADLLRARLKQVAPDAPARLHRRAADWFEQQELVGEAIQHALAAGVSTLDGVSGYEQAARLVETHTFALFVRGELDGLQNWMRLLPDDLADSRPWLCVQKAWMLVFAGRLAEVEPLLRKVEANLSAIQPEDRTALEGHCAAMRCFMLVFAPDNRPIFTQIKLVEEKLSLGSWARGVASWAVGFVLREQGDLVQSSSIFEILLQERLRASDPWGVAMAATDLGLVRRQQGRAAEALRVFRQALEFVEERGARGMGYTARLLTAVSSVLYDRGELDAAYNLLEEAVALTVRWHNPNHTLFANLNKARVLAARGDLRAAAGIVEAAEDSLRSLPVAAGLAQSVHSMRMTLSLAGGHIPPPADSENIADETPPYSEVAEARLLLRSRVLLLQRRLTEAMHLLDLLESSARSRARVLALIDILTLKALALHFQADDREAPLRPLEEALTLAAPENVLRPMIDSALAQEDTLRQLLRALRRSLVQRGIGSSLPEFIDRILAALPLNADNPAAGSPAISAPLELIEPLSARELEVLNLLAQGLTNAQIAERLVISKGTVKAHTTNIYRKLDAENRTQAVAISRAAGLV